MLRKSHLRGVMRLPQADQAIIDLQALGVMATPDMILSLFRYCALLEQWQQRINLVGPKTLETVWQRHILDSAQLVPLLPQGALHLTDIGSGAGFPALVLSILCPDITVTCVESDTRKCAFLSAVARDLHLKTSIRNHRIEAYDWANVDVLTARALASLADLTPYLRAGLTANPEMVAILPKGAQAQAELEVAPDLQDMFHVKHVSSASDPMATILVFHPR